MRLTKHEKLVVSYFEKFMSRESRIEFDRNYCSHYAPKPGRISNDNCAIGCGASDAMDRARAAGEPNMSPCIGGHKASDALSLCPKWERRSLEHAEKRANGCCLRLSMVILMNERNHLPASELHHQERQSVNSDTTSLSPSCEAHRILRSGPRSISGAPLEGDKLVKFAYLDESGISVNERISIVAAVIIDADSQWRRVENHLHLLAKEFVPEKALENFKGFHATELFHRPPRLDVERPHEALKEILKIPAKFGLGVAFGFFRKPIIDKPENQSQKQRRSEASDQAHRSHAISFAMCFMGVEMYMQRHTPHNEIATLVAENNTETGKTVKRVAASGGKEIDARARRMAFDWQVGGVAIPAPIRRIVHRVFMAEKDEASLLQIADACATVIRYCLEGRSNAAEFIDALSVGHPENIHDHGTHLIADNEAGYNILTFGDHPELV